jgi:S-adenosylmethionine:tRNA ribosyltransferase-isomerase
MLVSEFDYVLPVERIAQEPLADRAASRMLQLDRLKGTWRDGVFREFPDLLRPDDLLVLNNTRVFAARLYAQRSGNRAQASNSRQPVQDFLRGRVEVLLTRQLTVHPNDWECLVRPGRKIGVGERLYFRHRDAEAGGSGAALEAEVVASGSFGERRIRFEPAPNFFEVVEQIGQVPLPPYIRRDADGGGPSQSDRQRYQTVYAQPRGSVAAPTAGLHFTPEVLSEIRGRGVEIAEITLHVGLGTFQPVRVERVEDHKLHREWYAISDQAAEAIRRAKNDKRRVVAVGTTTVRTLEFAAELGTHVGKGIEAGSGEADIFIYPGYKFRVVDALLTNFHLPQSSLLMLVCALGGKDLVMAAYHHAVETGYRFYSYGDCMLLE